MAHEQDASATGDTRHKDRRLRLRLRACERDGAVGDAWHDVVRERLVPVTEAAILLCDVWDTHWCRGCAERVDVLAPAMDAVVGAARANGVQIIHAPSDTMAFYAGTPYRQRAQAIPRVAPSASLERTSPPLPIDDSDGGCDTGERPGSRPWTRQHPAIAIMGDDIISDDGGEIYSLLRRQGITTLLIMGVHTNMCVLNRSFGIKRMTRWGIDCVLVRDLTDAMYNPRMPPYVSQAEGTALVVRHIERYWCPSVLSDDLHE